MKEKTLFEKTQQAKRAVQKVSKVVPRVGIILGTGLGVVRKQMEVRAEIDYRKIPHFPEPTALSHKGRLILGKLAGVPVVVMEGRYHAYEGCSPEQITLPVRLMHALGARTLLTSSAVGGMNPYFQKGDLMLVDDHINFMGMNPLMGPNEKRFGERFPDMSEPYSRKLMTLARKSALKNQLTLREGVLVAVTGPCLETRAEYRMMRSWGADAVGMSTVPEVIVANHMKMQVLAVSVITDLCLPDALKPINVPEVIEIANQAGPKLATLFKGVLEALKK